MQLLTLDDFWDNQIILPAGLSDRNRPNDSLQYSSIMLTILVCWAAGPACLRNNCLVLMSSHFGFLVGICLEQFWESTPALFEIDVWQAQVLTRTPAMFLELSPAQCLKRSQRRERRKCSQETSALFLRCGRCSFEKQPVHFYNGRGIVIGASGHKKPLRFFGKNMQLHDRCCQVAFRSRKMFARNWYSNFSCLQEMARIMQHINEYTVLE